HPRFDLYPADNVTLDKAVTDVQQTLTQLEAFLKAEMKWSQARYAEQTNKHRTSPPVYNIGDSVWLLRRNIKTTRPSDKLRSEEHTSELQSRANLVCRLLLEKKQLRYEKDD